MHAEGENFRDASCMRQFFFIYLCMKLSEFENSESKVKSAGLDELKSKPADELMKIFQSEVEERKRRGEFDFESLKNLALQVRPFVSEETFQSLLAALEKVK